MMVLSKATCPAGFTVMFRRSPSSALRTWARGRCTARSLMVMMGVVIIRMITSTRATSMLGVTLIPMMLFLGWK